MFNCLINWLILNYNFECDRLIELSTNSALTKSYRTKRQLSNPLRWPIYVINSVDINQ